MEPSLAVAFKELKADVGFFLGWGRGEDYGDVIWTTQQTQAIDRCVKGGLRNFYHCGYNWSFLRPVVTLPLQNADQTVSLPDDFGGVEGQVVVTLGETGIQWWPVEFGGVGKVYQEFAQYPTSTGRPMYCCVEPLKEQSPVRGQRFQLRFWPISDGDYTLKFQYYINPDYLSGTFPYAYGGAQHAECLLESCLALAEKILDNRADLHEQEFEKRLAISQKMDGRNKPQFLGYNGDWSDRRSWRYSQHGLSPITIGGITPI